MNLPPLIQQEIVVFGNQSQRGELYSAACPMMFTNPRATSAFGKLHDNFGVIFPGVDVRRLVVVHINHNAESVFT
jgi:hypothetical protein